MKASAVAVVLFGFGCAVLAAADPKPVAHPDSSRWPDLLKPDLSDATYPAGVWTFKDGVLTATEDKNLWTNETFGDCVLDLEFRFEAAANSGVFVYNSDPENWVPKSVEIQICDDAAKPWRDKPATWHCGAFFGHQPPTRSAVKAAGEWNRMTVTCRGPRVTVVLNGEAVNDVDLARWTDGKANPDSTAIPKWLQGEPWAKLPYRGRVGFQGRHNGSGIFFRNMKVLRL